MFYSALSTTINNPLTYINPLQVYSGQYWDDFGLTPFMVPETAKVLMLGLSLGGAIRPLLSSTKSITLTCVDSDFEATEKCKTLFRHNFPLLSFEPVVADAKEFLQDTDDQYDFIWLDIYDSQAYAPLCFETDFIDLIQASLTPGGILAVNAYGIPNQFRPLEKNTIQRELARTLQKTFSFVYHTPFRRNQTLFASFNPLTVTPAKPHPQLSAIDKKSFRMQQFRASHISTLEMLETLELDICAESQFSQIDFHMRNEWQALISNLKRYDIHLTQTAGLLNLIQNEALCCAFLDRALSQKDISISFVPILCAGESYVQNLDVTWIFDWTIRNQDRLKEFFSPMYEQIWIPQLWSLILHPSKKYRRHAFQVTNLLSENL